MHGAVPEPESAHEPRHTAEPAAGRLSGAGDRRRELNKVFGEVVPRVGSDERGPETAGAGPEDNAWYLENRPPHYDR